MRGIIRKLRHYSQPLLGCIDIGSETEDRQGRARLPRASNLITMKNEKAIIIGSILFGVFSIGMGNMAQYEETQQYFSMVGIISIVWSGAFYITVKQESNETK